MIAGLKPYPVMKDSGVPWLGEVPTHWELPRLGAVLRERGETNADGRVTNVLSVTKDRGVIPYEEKGNVGNKKSDDITRYKIVRPGDVVVNCMNVIIGSVGLSQYTGCLSPVYYVLMRRSESDDPRYLNSYFQTKPFQLSLVRIGNGILAHRMRIPMELLKSEPFPKPPSDEQVAIVRFLDHADRQIRRYIRAKQKLIIIQRATTRGLDHYVRLKPSGVEWLGDVPAHWEIRRAKAICSAIVDCKNRTPDAVDSGRYLVVRTTCVRGGRFEEGGGYPTDERNYRIWTTRGAPRKGDVFFTREAPAGEACLVPDREDLCMGQRMMYFRPDPDLLHPVFLLLSIYGPLTKTYVDLATNGSTVGHLRLGQVYALPILWCPVAEQRAIVEHVEAATLRIDRAHVHALREIKLLREYRTRLIADVVTGKFDVREAAARLPQEVDAQDPLDEPEVESHIERPADDLGAVLEEADA
jgi:type I restriction enzyme, S subunit